MRDAASAHSVGISIVAKLAMFVPLRLALASVCWAGTEACLCGLAWRVLRVRCEYGAVSDWRVSMAWGS